jgi:hypothetical protein
MFPCRLGEQSLARLSRNSMVLPAVALAIASCSRLAQPLDWTQANPMRFNLRYLLTDVPPQPNSPPDNVFHLDRRRNDLELEEGTESRLQVME